MVARNPGTNIYFHLPKIINRILNDSSPKTDPTLKNLEIMDKTNSSKRPPKENSCGPFRHLVTTIFGLRGSRCCSACRSNGNSSHTKVDPVPALLSPAPARSPQHLAAWISQQKRHLAGKSRGSADRNNQENGRISSHLLGLGWFYPLLV